MAEVPEAAVVWAVATRIIQPKVAGDNVATEKEAALEEVAAEQTAPADRNRAILT